MDNCTRSNRARALMSDAEQLQPKDRQVPAAWPQYAWADEEPSTIEKAWFH